MHWKPIRGDFLKFTERVLVSTIVPLLFKETVIQDKNHQIITVIRGIPLKNLQHVCRSLETFHNLLKLIQRYLTPFKITLQVYIHEEEYYLTAVSFHKISSYLSRLQAYILGIFITMRESRKEPIPWNDLEKELKEGTIKKRNVRKHVEFLVSRGLLYKTSLNPLIFEYAPIFFLEFDEEGISKITEVIKTTLLIGSENEIQKKNKIFPKNS